ncbi:Rossmann-like domain-containing protein [Lacrimispora brassicae]
MGNILLKETTALVQNCLGSDLESITVERAVFGLFFSGVKLSNGMGGLCFTPVKEIPAAVCCPSSAKAMPLSGRLKGRSAADYLSDLDHSNILRKTLAIATLNALSAACWQSGAAKGYQLQTGVDAFDNVQIPQGGKSVVVGALVPILKRLIAAEADFKVLEMDNRTLKGKELEHYARPEDASSYIPEADLLVITGVTVLNDTLPDLLNMIKPGAQVIVTGPTASMLPDAFFQRGVTTMGGVLVTKPDEVLDIISEGGSGYHFFGKSAERLIINKNQSSKDKALF